MSQAPTTMKASMLAPGQIAPNILSSIVVFLVALPLCMGIAIASGVPPAAGLITGVIGGIVVGAFAGSPLLVSGPAAGLAVLVFELVRDHGLVALGPVVLLAGAMQLAAGLFKVGLWFRMVAPAVIHGMLAGIGILIIASQLHVMVDAKPLAGGLQNFGALPGRIWDVVTSKQGLEAGLLGLGVIAVMIGWEKFKPAKLKLVPGALLAIILATVIAQVAQLDVARVNLPENLFGSIEFVGSSGLAMLLDPTLLGIALAFAFIASAETLLSAAAVDSMHTGPRTKYDCELCAQGIGNMLCGFAGALPMTGVIVRSAANVQAGATSRLSTILHGTWLLGFVVLLPWLLRMAPIAALAGILVFTGFKMINPKQLRELAHYGKGTLAVFLATALMIVATDLLMGVAAGIALSLLFMALRAAYLHVGLKKDEATKTATLRLTGSATFLNVPRLSEVLDSVPDGTTVTVDMEKLRMIDHACLVLLQDWSRTAHARGCKLVVDWQALEALSEAGSKRGRVQGLTTT